ncbi:cupin domain-containing protein [Streptomyces sp. NPDC087658]|uniref:cupin domain-containing protein n=1 Tax=Streptomyces sp. NPDC087658 TaxID=3365800 RepID=UPI003823D880
MGSGGRVFFTDRDGSRELGPSEEFLRFIDEGQFAHYFVGDAKTCPERPSNATFELGVVGPRSTFTPHAHGGERFVLGLGRAGCGLYDATRGRVAEVTLLPGELIRIPEMMPHSFANRGSRPPNILAANTGYGIDHEDYAITAEEVERRFAASADADFTALAAALRDIERLQRVRGIGAVTVRERLAAGLRRAAALEGLR